MMEKRQVNIPIYEDYSELCNIWCTWIRSLRAIDKGQMEPFHQAETWLVQRTGLPRWWVQSLATSIMDACDSAERTGADRQSNKILSCLTRDMLMEVYETALTKKIQAIKYLRSETGMGLKSAKAIVDAMMDIGVIASKHQRTGHEAMLSQQNAEIAELKKQLEWMKDARDDAQSTLFDIENKVKDWDRER